MFSNYVRLICLYPKKCFFSRKFKTNDKEPHYAIIVDNDKQMSLVAYRNFHHEHPLKHSKMIPINLLVANSVCS